MTVADLGLDVWQLLDAHELSPESGKDLAAFLYQLSVPKRKVAIPSGMAIPWLLALPLNLRLRNALLRHFRESRRYGILHSPMECEEFLSIRGCGKTALIEILCVLESVELGLVPEHLPPQSIKSTASDSLDRLVPEQLEPQTRSKPMVMSEVQFQAAIQEATRKALLASHFASDSIGSHLQELATWALSETDARTVGEAISSAASSPSPPASWRAVAGMELIELAEIPNHPYDILDSWVADLPEREIYVFRNRVALIDGSYTLQQLASNLGISRERVRQLERRVLSKLTAFTRKAVASPIKWRLQTIKHLVGTAAPLGHVQHVLHLGNGQTDYRFVFLRLAGPYDINGDWVVLRSAVDNDPTEKVCEMADEVGFINEDLAERELSRWGLFPRYHREWLTHTGRVREFNGRLARWEGSIGDKIVIALAAIGHPTTVDALLECTQEDRTRGSALNALSGDRRVVRVSRTEWALASWGLPEYSSIAMSIRDFVSDSRGSVHIEEIITHMRNNNFGVSEGSIKSYCYAPMFVVEGGWVSLRDDLNTYRYPNFSPRTARGVFALGPGRASLLVEVSEDLVRGSGRNIPLALGAILDLPINQELTFTNDNGASITIAYPETSFGPAMGSVRLLAESVGAGLGQYLTVILDRSAMSVTGAATSVGEHPPSWQLVARLTGIEASTGIRGLASALDCSVSEIRASLKSRGDDIVAKAIPAETSTSSGLDEALSRLEGQLQLR